MEEATRRMLSLLQEKCNRAACVGADAFVRPASEASARILNANPEIKSQDQSQVDGGANLIRELYSP